MSSSFHPWFRLVSFYSNTAWWSQHLRAPWVCPLSYAGTRACLAANSAEMLLSNKYNGLCWHKRGLYSAKKEQLRIRGNEDCQTPWSSSSGMCWLVESFRKLGKLVRQINSRFKAESAVLQRAKTFGFPAHFMISEPYFWEIIPTVANYGYHGNIVAKRSGLYSRRHETLEVIHYLWTDMHYSINRWIHWFDYPLVSSPSDSRAVFLILM